LEAFSQNTSAESEKFNELMDYIWDAGVCLPPFYAVIPHLIDITAKQTFEIAKDLWIYIGSWISVQEKFRSGIPDELLNCFDLSLKYAEKVCARVLSEQEKISEVDAIYLYSGLFAFSGHAFGYMTLSAYKDDMEGTSIAKCDEGHLNDITVYNSGIVPYEREEKPHIIVSVTTSLPMKFAFSLCGSLLYCEGSVDLSSRIFHGWDVLKCQSCGEEYQFSEHWCENN
jgi:hypothetical protein